MACPTSRNRTIRYAATPASTAAREFLALVKGQGTYLAEIRRQLVETEALVATRQSQHTAGCGEPIRPNNVWLEQRNAEIRSMKLEVTALQAQSDDSTTVVRDECRPRRQETIVLILRFRRRNRISARRRIKTKFGVGLGSQNRFQCRSVRPAGPPDRAALITRDRMRIRRIFLPGLTP